MSEIEFNKKQNALQQLVDAIDKREETDIPFFLANHFSTVEAKKIMKMLAENKEVACFNLISKRNYASNRIKYIDHLLKMIDKL